LNKNQADKGSCLKFDAAPFSSNCSTRQSLLRIINGVKQPVKDDLFYNTKLLMLLLSVL